MVQSAKHNSYRQADGRSGDGLELWIGFKSHRWMNIELLAAIERNLKGLGQESAEIFHYRGAAQHLAACPLQIEFALQLEHLQAHVGGQIFETLLYPKQLRPGTGTKYKKFPPQIPEITRFCGNLVAT